MMKFDLEKLKEDVISQYHAGRPFAPLEFLKKDISRLLNYHCLKADGFVIHRKLLSEGESDIFSKRFDRRPDGRIIITNDRITLCGSLNLYFSIHPLPKGSGFLESLGKKIRIQDNDGQSPTFSSEEGFKNKNIKWNTGSMTKTELSGTVILKILEHRYQTKIDIINLKEAFKLLQKNKRIIFYDDFHEMDDDLAHLKQMNLITVHQGAIQITDRGFQRVKLLELVDEITEVPQIIISFLNKKE